MGFRLGLALRTPKTGDCRPESSLNSIRVSGLGFRALEGRVPADPLSLNQKKSLTLYPLFPNPKP